MIQHPIAPVYDEASNVLILGSFPSVKSREQGFFYGHPQNRFWRVLSAVYEKPVPQTVEDKKAFLLENGVAVWDVIASCDIQGSADSSIRNAQPTDLGGILAKGKIRQIYVNGRKAEHPPIRGTRPVLRRSVCRQPVPQMRRGALTGW